MNQTRAAEYAAVDEGISPLLGLQTALRYWWVLAALTALGALAGWALHLTRPVRYEAITRLPIGIDYVRTGPLTQFEEDIAMEVVGGMLVSADVVDRVVARAADAGITVSPQDLRAMVVLERRLNVWEMRIRAAEPTAARQIANLWMEEGYAVVRESYEHAVMADRLSQYARSLETCLARTAVSEPAYVGCSYGNAQEVQQALVQTGEQLYQEQMASRGLFSGLMIGQPEYAQSDPSQPIRYGRAGFSLGGALFGLALAIIFVEMGLVRRFEKRS